ncbi:basic secretory protein-like protein [Halopolyspora algeriensis]|uniref:basic secretory protein-like protein n=1 Tax=Halopolyspora algeriensis TaxID=1500506 RepID=UPI001FE80F34|nr:basic secretory protein-like protein [Halopolyspora algeriensis]
MQAFRTWRGCFVVALLAVITMVVWVVGPISRQPGPVLPRERGAGHPERSAPGGRAAASSREYELTRLLQRRAEALRTRDETVFMASVDPKASTRFQRKQRMLFRNLREVPLAEWSYRLDATATVLPPDPGTLPVPPDELWAPRVVLSYALAGVDTVPTTRVMGYLFARRGDSWYLTSDTALQEQGRSTWRGPWDHGMVRVVPTDSGLVLGHDRNLELVHRAARMLDDSIAAVTEVWGTGWSRRIGVVVPGSRAELRALVSPAYAVDGIAAVAVADEVDTTTGRVEGPRVVLNTQTAEPLSDSALRVVLEHEITHIATRADTVEAAPMWMLEGFADYVGYRGSGIPPERIAPDLIHRLRAEGPPTTLPSDRDFRLSGSRLDLAYQQSWSVVRFLARELGERRLVELYHRIAGSRSPEEVEEALQDLAGMDLAELIESWGRYLLRTFD